MILPGEEGEREGWDGGDDEETVEQGQHDQDVGDGPLEVDEGAEEDADAEDVAEEAEGANDGHHYALGGVNQLGDNLKKIC